MGLFGGKNLHERQVERLVGLTGQLYEMTTESDEVSPFLKFERKDARFRYMFFCLSSVHVACASLMKKPDAVLNEVTQILFNYCYSEADTFFGETPDPQEAANKVILVQDFLNRWSAWVDIVEGGNTEAALGIVCGMIHDCESERELQSTDTERLAFVASWIAERFPDAYNVFKKA